MIWKQGRLTRRPAMRLFDDRRFQRRVARIVAHPALSLPRG
jgi:hypothetical protein